MKRLHPADRAAIAGEVARQVLAGLRAAAAAAARFRAALVAVEDASAIVREIAGIAHAIEWCASGDTGPDDVADECIAWMAATAEATKETPCE